MPHGAQLAQVAHAAAEAGGGHTDGTHVVVLEASKSELYKLHDDLPEHESHFDVSEPDEPFCGELTAIAFPVQPREGLRALLRKFKLAGGRGP